MPALPLEEILLHKSLKTAAVLWALWALWSGAAMAEVNCADFNTAAFFATAREDDVWACLETGAALTAADSIGRTPLFHAVSHAKTPLMIDMLLDHAYETGILEEVLAHRDGRGRSVMHVAAEDSSDPAMLTWLERRRSGVFDEFDCGDGWLAGCTVPIHLAARRPDGFCMLRPCWRSAPLRR